MKRFTGVSAAAAFLFFVLPNIAAAAAVTVSAFTATSTPAYTNTGLATTTRAKVGDTIQYQLTLSGGAPLVAPQINIFNTGSTTMTGSGVNWFYATTTTANTSVWANGLVSFRVSVGQDTLVAVATTTVTAVTSGSNTTFDSTGPTLTSVAWSDTDGSTQFSATDTLTLTFSETMATSTVTTGNVDTVLGLTNSHTFGTSPTVSWNTAGTILTLTLGTSPTVATADTVDPTTAVKDAIGNNDATSAPVTITDNVAPPSPSGLSDASFKGTLSVALSSTGSSAIYYTTDGSTPSCGSGTLYSTPIELTESVTLKAIACDEASNASSVVSATYTRRHSGGGGSGGGGSYHPVTPATPATPATRLPSCGPGQRFDVNTGAPCMTSAIPATPSSAALAHASANARFNRDLQVGTSGDDVQSLQQFLNAHGFVIASTGPGSLGNETMTFGALTRAALAAYQKAKGITPAAGYLGPKTRASIGSEQ